MNDNAAEFSLKDVEEMDVHRVVIIIEDNVYDVTDYVACHPGGSEVLLKHNRKDATEEFKLIGHSSSAKALLQNYKIGVLAGAGEKEFKRFEGVGSNWFSYAKTKLITEEDPYFFHKTFGLVVLLHIAVRSILLAFDAGNSAFDLGTTEFYSDNFFSDNQKLFFAFCHGMLSLSSFIFFIPAHSNQSKPMIHRMFRAHNVCFALRAVLCMVIDVLIKAPELKRFMISCVVLSCFIAADFITKHLALSVDRYKTTDSMPYWPGCNVEREKLHKNFYAFAQFLASIVCLFGTYSTIFFTLPAIQGAALLMTLVRKNIITSYMYHQIYTFLLFYPIPLLLIIIPELSILAISGASLLFFLRKYNINKYLLWIPIIAVANIMELDKAYYPAALIAAIIAFMLTLYIVKTHLNIFEHKRIDANNRVLSNIKITPNSYELIIRTKTPINLEIGQHVVIQVNGVLNRKYTPIWSKYIEETDQSVLCLRIKEYKRDYLTVSSYLAGCKDGSLLDLYGPYGSKFYSIQDLAIIDSANNLKYDISKYRIYLFSAGSGITPIYQLAKNIVTESGQKVQLITCDQNYEHQMLGPELCELKDKFPHLLDWTCFFSKEEKDLPYFAGNIIRKRLSPEHIKNILGDNDFAKEQSEMMEAKQPALVVICGPASWQDLIVKTVKDIYDFSILKVSEQDSKEDRYKILLW